MLTVLRGRGTDRKFRLFACACCRRIWHLLDPAISGSVLDIHPRTLVEVAEQCADDRADPAELDACRYGSGTFNGWHPAGQACLAARLAVPDDASVAAPSAAKHAVQAASGRVPEDPDEVPPNDSVSEAAEFAAQAGLVRDIFGNPFRHAAFDPGWRTEAAVGLARGMYASRNFGPMPVLADALADAGCPDPNVLAHCRSGGSHVRGCWVVDLVLGKG